MARNVLFHAFFIFKVDYINTLGGLMPLLEMGARTRKLAAAVTVALVTENHYSSTNFGGNV